MGIGYWDLFKLIRLIFFMLFSQNRLRKKKDFERVMKDRASKSVAVSFLAGRFLSNGLALSRVGFVVSKKISKKAVERNKVKRRLREATRSIINKIRPGFDIVVFTRQGIVESDFTSIKQNLETLLKKAGLLRQIKNPSTSSGW